MSLSLQVKQELLRAGQSTERDRTGILLTALAAVARKDGPDLKIVTSLEPYATLLWEELTHRADVPARRVREHGRWTVTVPGEDAVRRLDGWSRGRGLNLATRRIASGETDEDHRALLRGYFLACGALGEPVHGYHLEFSSRYDPPAEQIAELLEREEIAAHRIRRGAVHVVYSKEGDRIADFLLVTGAHAAYLAFESLRVEKDVRNTVTRMVNCDTANSSRIAATAARQLAAIRLLERHPGLQALSPDLQEAARARRTHPEWSIQELGEAMSPPLGKSGMRHRLRRLERLAEEQITDTGM